MKDYRKLQSCCISLNKLTNDIKYLEWCGISMYFQGMKGSILMYDLCEKTLIKTLNDNSDSELLRFVCILYEKKKQYEEAINLLKLHPVKEEKEKESEEEKEKKTESTSEVPPFVLYINIIVFYYICSGEILIVHLTINIIMNY